MPRIFSPRPFSFVELEDFAAAGRWKVIFAPNEASPEAPARIVVAR